MDRIGPKRFPVNPFEAPKPTAVISVESGEEGRGGNGSQRRRGPEGWLGVHRATKKMHELGADVAESTLRKLINQHRLDHPEWYKKIARGHIIEEFYHPALLALLAQEILSWEKAPESWKTRGSLAKEFGTDWETVKKFSDSLRRDYPDSFKVFRGEMNRPEEHLSPEVVEMVRKEFRERKKASAKGVSPNKLAHDLGRDPAVIYKLLEEYQNKYPQFILKKKGITYIAPELATFFSNEIAEREHAPIGWRVTNDLLQKLSTTKPTLRAVAKKLAKDNPEWIREYYTKSKPAQKAIYYSPELTEFLVEYFTKQEDAPSGWKSNADLSRELSYAKQSITDIAEEQRPFHPAWFKLYKGRRGHYFEHYHPELVKLIEQRITQITSIPRAPFEWKTMSYLVKVHRDLSYDEVKKIVEPYRALRPDWFKLLRPVTGVPCEHFHPNLVNILERSLETKLTKITDAKKNIEQVGRLEKLLNETRDASSATGQHFRSLLKAFGSSRYLDVLYQFRPEFKGIPSERVKGLMAEYLGDFLVSRGGFDKESVEAALEHLSDLSLREGLYETVKDDCFQLFLKLRRTEGIKNPELVLERYRERVEKELGHLDHPLFREVVERAIGYYSDLYSTFEKPPRIVDSLEPGRDFPDLNQLINIREIKEKKRMLIADEMGLGKSASVILSKESLGVHCALTIVPSNVIETWKRYLSDKPEQGGYFKPGEGPRVFVVEDSKQLQKLSWDQYDYIIISQEKLQGAYPEQLRRIGYDMLIVDEAHKLKTPAGTRSSNLAELTEEAGEHGYLALLSGTPVPNKIEDVAVTLKLLYPAKFKDIKIKQLVQSIIKGDLVDLRSLLLPKMQRKRLEDGVEMPSLIERESEIELSKMEQQVYEVLLEDDELLATEKMRVLRQFLLNPALVDSTPGIEGAKVAMLRKRLEEAFKESSSVVVFVNDYVEGVLRGPDSLPELLELSQDIQVRTIHGHTSREERAEIQHELRKQDGEKILLLVSGQTADVGVDFSSAHHVIFYNEPWTEYQKRQELGRVYRPGLKYPLESETLIADGTIEQGMHEYIARKHQAIEKLLNGVPITELERQLLSRAETEAAPDLSVNPELARYYFSSWDKMMKIFGYIKELGEERFEKFLKDHGSEYAEGYQELGNRSYQANANRLAATLIDRLVKNSNKDPAIQRILDLASGPEMLRRHSQEAYRNGVVSLDLNPEHFKIAEGKFVSGSWLHMPFPDKTFDFLNLSLSLHYTSYIPSKGKLERLQLIREMNRVLEIGGRAVLTLIYSYGLKNPDMFREAVKEFGFEVNEDWTGEATSGSSFQALVITLEKQKDIEEDLNVEELSARLGKEKREGFKFAEQKGRLRDSRRILTGVELRGRTLPIRLSREDQEAFEEEQTILKQGEALRDEHGDIAKIPREKVIRNGFVRIRSGEKYLLFRKLEKGSGAVLIR